MAKKTGYDSAQVNELLYQALETELGGVQVYETALRCAVNEDLHKEWNEYLDQTRTHVKVLANVFETLGLDIDASTPGRMVVRHLGESLVLPPWLESQRTPIEAALPKLTYPPSV